MAEAATDATLPSARLQIRATNCLSLFILATVGSQRTVFLLDWSGHACLAASPHNVILPTVRPLDCHLASQAKLLGTGFITTLLVLGHRHFMHHLLWG